MIRVLGYIAVFAVLAALGAWLADHPGAVVVHWRNYVVETSAAAFVVAVVVVAVVVAVIWRLISGLLAGPGRLRAAASNRRLRRGQRALTRGLVAAAAGDVAGARRAASDAERLLSDPPLTLLLSAQAAQLNGDESGARAAFEDMLGNPETEFLGLRGLVVQAIRDGDTTIALRHARRAFEISPTTGWVLTHLGDLEISAGHWLQAEQVTDAAVRAGWLTATDGARRRAALQYQRAVQADRDGRASEALDLVRKAVDAAPGLVPAVDLEARLLLAAGRRRRAKARILRGWAEMAHPDLARVYVDAVDAQDPLDRVRALDELVKARPDAVDGQLALAEAAIDAELWGTAREHLAQEATTLTVGACRLMARLEEAETGDAALSRTWLVRAASAPPDPAWVCRHCGTPTAAWSITCGNCRQFDSLDWRQPASLSGAVIAVEDRPALAAGEATAAGSNGSGAEPPDVVVVEATESPTDTAPPADLNQKSA